jgi:hypothetical protein
MKQIKNLLFVAITAFTFTATSCTEDKCKEVVCANGGSCDEKTGACVCASGFEGTDCKTLSRAKFLNANGYQVVEDGTLSASATYAVGVTASGVDSTSLLISNVYDAFANTVKATVTGPSTFAIARQEPDADKYFVEGTGTLSGNIITLKYKVTFEPVGGSILNDDFGTATGSASIWTKK